MKYESIEDTVAELQTIIDSFTKTLVTTSGELESARVETKFLRNLGEIETFVKTVLSEAMRVPEQERLTALASGYGKILEALGKEQTRLRDRVVSLSERTLVLESTQGYLTNRKDALIAKKAAIERVASETGDSKRPERISVKREAEKLKKSREEDK